MEKIYLTAMIIMMDEGVKFFGRLLKDVWRRLRVTGPLGYFRFEILIFKSPFNEQLAHIGSVVSQKTPQKRRILR